MVLLCEIKWKKYGEKEDEKQKKSHDYFIMLLKRYWLIFLKKIILFPIVNNESPPTRYDKVTIRTLCSTLIGRKVVLNGNIPVACNKEYPVITIKSPE